MIIELNDIEALVLRLLSDANAFGIKAGSATIHFDNTGYPTAVETTITFRAHKVIPTSQEVDKNPKIVI